MNKELRELILERRRVAQMHSRAADRDRAERNRSLAAVHPTPPARTDVILRLAGCSCPCHTPTRGMTDPHPGLTCPCKAA